MIRNRRQHRRNATSEVLPCRRDGAPFEGVMVNFSAGGAFFAGYRAPDVCEVIEVSFATRDGETIEILAQVVHIAAPSKHSDAGYGVRWVEAVCDAGANAMRAFLRDRFEIRDALAVIARRGGPASFTFPEPVTVDPTSFDERIDRTIAAKSEEISRVVSLVRSGVSLDRATRRAREDESADDAIGFHEKSTAVVERSAAAPVRRATQASADSRPSASYEAGFVGAGEVHIPRTMPAMSPLMPVGNEPRRAEAPTRNDLDEDSDVPFDAPLPPEAIAELPTMAVRDRVGPNTAASKAGRRRDRRRRVRPRHAPAAPDARVSREQLAAAATSDLIRRQIAEAQTHQVREDGDVAQARGKGGRRKAESRLDARDRFEVPLDPETQRQAVEDLLASADRLFTRRATEHKPLPEDLEEARNRGRNEGTQTLGSRGDLLDELDELKRKTC